MKNEKLALIVILSIFICIIISIAYSISKLDDAIRNTLLSITLPLIGGMFALMLGKYFENLLNRNNEYFKQKSETADTIIDYIFRIQKIIENWIYAQNHYTELVSLLNEALILSIKYGDAKIIQLISRIDYKSGESLDESLSIITDNAITFSEIICELRDKKRLLTDRKVRLSIKKIFISK
jgi:hypothetical protein